MRNVLKFLSATALGIGIGLTAPAVQAGLVTSPPLLDFADSAVGNSEAIILTVFNDGLGGDETITSTSIQGDPSGNFTITGDGCTGATLTANPAGDCTLEVTFAPLSCQEPGQGLGAVVRVTYGGGDVNSDTGAQGVVLCDDGQPDPTPSGGPIPNGACDVLQFSQPFYSFHEGDAQAQVWVTRMGCGEGVATADYTIGSQTAVLNTDFGLVGPSPQTVTFPAGNFVPQAITFDISGAFDDLLEEYSEQFSVILSNPRRDGQITPDLVLGSIATAEAEIIDNDVPGVIQFGQPVYYFDEGNLTAAVAVTRTGGSSGQVSATISVNLGTTEGAADFINPANPPVVTFGDGTTTTQYVTFPIVDDTLLEGDEYFTLTLGSATGGASIGTISSADVHIVDNDVPGVIQFGQPVYYFDEGNLTAAVAVTRTGGSSGPVTALISVNNGTTEGAVDFTTGNLLVSFNDGNTDTQYVTFPILEDNLQEGDEYFTLTLGSVTGGASIGTIQTTDVHIVDNDVAGVIQFGAPHYYFIEGNMMADVVVTRTGGSNNDVTATVTVNPQTATLTADFVAPLDLTVEFANGDSAPKTLTFQITQDNFQEGEEIFNLVLGSPTGGASLGTLDSTTVHIIDDDVAGVIQFSQPTYYFIEGNLMANVFVTRTGGSSNDVTATVTVSPQTATAADFTPPMDLTVEFQNGDTSPKALTFAIPQDTLEEGDEFFNLVLGSPTGGASIGTIDNAEVHIIDDDINGVLQFGQIEYYFDEGNLMAQVAVTRTGGSSGEVSATVSINNGTTEGALDFTPPPAADLTVEFLDGDAATKYVTFQILEDVLQEGDEYFILTLGAPTGGVSIGSIDTTTVHIIDDDVAGTLQFSEPHYYFVEGNLMAQVFVTRVGGSSGQVGATLTISSATAESGVDFTPPPAPVQVDFADGDTTPQAVNFQIVQDTLEEGEEIFTLLLSNPTNGASLGEPQLATVHIIDDDTAGLVQFSASVYTFKEDVGSAIIYVNRIGGNSGPVSVHYSTSNGTATAPEDYTNVEGVLTWVNGDTLPKPIVIPVFTDSEDEERRFNVILDGVTGDGELGTPSVAEVIILDAGVSPQPAGPSLEGGPRGGCSLGGKVADSRTAALPWVAMAMVALVFALLRKGTTLKATRAPAIVGLVLAASLALQACGDDPVHVRNQATADDYAQAIRVLSEITGEFAGLLPTVASCEDLNELNDIIVYDPVLFCDSGYIHVIPEVKACSDNAVFSGDWLVTIVPEDCIIQYEAAEVDGDLDLRFEPVDGAAPFEASLATRGISINEIEYLFYDLQVSVDANGVVTCAGGLTDQVTSCSVAADCSGCENM